MLNFYAHVFVLAFLQFCSQVHRTTSQQLQLLPVICLETDLAGYPPAIFLSTLPFSYFKMSTLPLLGYQPKNIIFPQNRRNLALTYSL